MNRRAFIAGLGSAVVWPGGARGQQHERARVVGMLIATRDNDPQGMVRVAAFRERLEKLGWIEGRNLEAGAIAERH